MPNKIYRIQSKLRFISKKLVSKLPLPFQSKLRFIHKKLAKLPLPCKTLCDSWLIAWDDVMGQHIRHNTAFEIEERVFLLKFLKPGMVVIDIGAHNGLYSLLASKKIGDKGQVFAFEPSPREFRRLKLNLIINRVNNVRPVNIALSNHVGPLQFHVSIGRETGCNSLRPPKIPDKIRPIRIWATTFDSYWKKNIFGSVDFIKIDAEGGELDLLKGAKEFLNCRPRPIIMVELEDLRTEPWGYQCRLIYEFLVERGFRWFSFRPEGILRPCPSKDYFQENLLSIPEERFEALSKLIEKT
jgi:FkbM family methyltransferase